MRRIRLASILWAAALPCAAAAADGESASEGAKALSGMSVLGNNEAPKSLVIVPWKSSRIGDGIGVENLLDQRAVPVDRDVFARELSFYELRKGSGGSDAGSGVGDD